MWLFFFLFKLLPLPWAPASLLLAGWSWASPGGDGGTETSLEEEPSRAPTQCPVSQQESLSAALLPPEIPGRGLDKGHDRWLRLSLPSAGKKKKEKKLAWVLGCVTHRGKKKERNWHFCLFQTLCCVNSWMFILKKRTGNQGVFLSTPTNANNKALKHKHQQQNAQKLDGTQLLTVV